MDKRPSYVAYGRHKSQQRRPETHAECLCGHMRQSCPHSLCRCSLSSKAECRRNHIHTHTHQRVHCVPSSHPLFTSLFISVALQSVTSCVFFQGIAVWHLFRMRFTAFGSMLHATCSNLFATLSCIVRLSAPCSCPFSRFMQLVRTFAAIYGNYF